MDRGCLVDGRVVGSGAGDDGYATTTAAEGVCSRPTVNYRDVYRRRSPRGGGWRVVQARVLGLEIEQGTGGKDGGMRGVKYARR